MPTLVEGNQALEFLLSESNGQRSRDMQVLLAGQNLQAGAPLAKNGGGKYLAYDGTNTAIAVLAYSCNATAGDQKIAVISRDTEVKDALLVFAGGITAPQRATAITQLAAVGIIAR